LKKLMIVAAMLAVALAVAIPAIAQTTLENEQETQSGDVALNTAVENTGNYASQCTPANQFGNTGNFNNAPTFLQYASEADDFEPGGLEFTVDPSLSVDCSSTIQQSAAASG
jgi:hypothetical protein